MSRKGIPCEKQSAASLSIDLNGKAAQAIDCAGQFKQAGLGKKDGRRLGGL